MDSSNIVYSLVELFYFGCTVLIMGFSLGVHLESTSWGSVTQGPEQGSPEVYINLGSHSFLDGSRASKGPWPSLPSTQVFQL